MSDHDGVRRALGSYVLGALDAAERSRVDDHLAGCADCREELSSYAALPGLMSRLGVRDVVPDELAPPPPSLLPRALAAVEAERAAGRRRLRRWRGAALGATSVAAAGLAAVLVLPGGSATTAPTVQAGRALVARPAGGPAAGSAALQARPWGTQVHLVLRGLPREGAFTAWAVDVAGSRTPAATWRATRDGRADVTGAAALDPVALVRLEVLALDGTAVLTTPA